MTAQTIHRWLAPIPLAWLGDLHAGSIKTGNAGNEGCIPDLLGDPAQNTDARKFALAYRNTCFGWNYARMLANRGAPFPEPAQGDDGWVFRAYLHLHDRERFRDRDISEAAALTGVQFFNQRALIEGLLLSPNVTIQDISRWTNQREPVIAAYERLFFNVLDRRKDALFMMRVVYPQGRTTEYRRDYLNRASVPDLLRRAGYNNEAEHVLYHAGYSNSLVTELASGSSARRLEDTMMAGAYVMASAGLLNQEPTSVPAILHAQRLIAAGKVGGEDTSSQSETQLWGEAIYNELQAYGDQQLLGIKNAMEADVIDVPAEAIERMEEGFSDTDQ